MLIETYATSTSSDITLAAATETNLLGAGGIDTSLIESFSITLSNTGANPIGTVTAYFKTRGTLETSVVINAASIAAGGKSLFQLDLGSTQRLRLTATSTAGTTVALEARGVREAA